MSLQGATLNKNKMIISEICLEKLKEFEGFRSEAYLDAAGVPTVGYGHTKNVKLGDHITEYCAREYLLQDLYETEQAVNALNVAKTPGQFDALVSFAYNLGIGHLKSSTLLKVIREGGSKLQITREFKRWVYAGGKPMRGLVLRREWEAKRFFE